MLSTRDIGVVQLASPLSIVPMPLHEGPLDPVVGSPALIVGYGQTTYQQLNQMRFEATTVVGALEGDTVLVGDATHRPCLGDSGGPAIVGGKVIGIDSYGPLGCDASAHYRRVDSHAAFIAQFVTPAMPPSPPPDGDPPPQSEPESEGGGCATHDGAGVLVGLGLLAWCRRRRA